MSDLSDYLGLPYASLTPPGEPSYPWFLWGFVILATLVAGAADPGAGLGVFSLGLLFAVTMDHAMWRQREALHQRPLR